MREKIINILLDKSKEFVSGEEISERLGITRSAVWKHIKSIKEQGYEIESFTKKGYKIISCPDLLTSEIIKYNLNTTMIGKDVIYFDSVESTNDYAKNIGREATEGTLVISEEQTKGRGRTGRLWHSSKGDGIYSSLILKPQIYPYDAPFLTQITAAAIVSGLKKIGIDAFIKWPNDIIINNKKVCGILTEMVAEIDKIEYLIIGMGINVKGMNFPQEIENMATSLIKEGYNMQRIDILKNILEEFEKLYLLYAKDKNKLNVINVCKEYSAILGKQVYIIKNDEKEKVKAIDINEKGNLVVIDENMEIKEIICGEVSIRGEHGYV